MGADAPKQKDAQGSGITTQRSILPEDIQLQSQNRFRGALRDAANSTGALDSLDSAAGFNPSSLSLQGRSQAFNLGNLYSKSLDPLVQAQLSQSLSENAGIANIKNQQLASQIGSTNPAALAAIQNQNSMQSLLASGPARLAALQQQRSFDEGTRAANVQSAQLELARQQAYNDSQLQGRAAAERAYAANLQGTQLNNQNQLQAAALQQDLLKSLGQGIISTAPQLQGNFTMADMKKYYKNPDYYQNFLGSGAFENLAGPAGTQGITTNYVPRVATAQQSRPAYRSWKGPYTGA